MIKNILTKALAKGILLLCMVIQNDPSESQGDDLLCGRYVIFICQYLMTLDILIASKVIANALGYDSMNLVIDDQKVLSLDIMRTIYESAMLTTVTGFNKTDTTRWHSK